jgi:membrane protein
VNDLACDPGPVEDGARSTVTEVKAVVRAIAREWSDDRVTGIAAEIAFFSVLSLFPVLLALVAALGSLEVIAGNELADRVEDAVLDFMHRVLTDQASGTIDAVQRLFDDASPGVLTVSTAVALWAASRGFAAVINGLDLAYDVEEGRTLVQRRVLALVLALGTIVIVAVALAMLVVGPLLGTGEDVADSVGLGAAFATFWDWARLPATAAAMVAWAATMFHIGPNRWTPWRWDLPGAVLTAVSWIGLSAGFRVYLSVAGETNEVLGTLGGALIVLLWLYLLAIGLLLGAELNAVLADRYGAPQQVRRPLSSVATRSSWRQGRPRSGRDGG